MVGQSISEPNVLAWAPEGQGQEVGAQQAPRLQYMIFFVFLHWQELWHCIKELSEKSKKLQVVVDM